MYKQRTLSDLIISEITNLECSSFFSKCSKFDGHSRNAVKNQKKSFVTKILVFEVVAEISAYSNGYSCHRQSVC